MTPKVTHSAPSFDTAPRVNVPFAEAELGAQLQSLGFSLSFAPEIGSTMSISSWLRERNVEPRAGAVLVAGSQPAGVGHSGAWLSHELDLKFTLLLPELPSPQAAQKLRMVAALSVVLALRTVSQDRDLPAFVKWPNDVRTMHAGQYRKIAGVLLHTRHDQSVCELMGSRGITLPIGLSALGVGVGLVPPAPDARVQQGGRELPLTEVASSLYCLTGTVFRREELLQTFLKTFQRLSRFAQEQESVFLEDFRATLATNERGEVLAHLRGEDLPPLWKERLSTERALVCRVSAIAPDSVTLLCSVTGEELTVPYRELLRTHPAGALDL